MAQTETSQKISCSWQDPNSIFFYVEVMKQIVFLKICISSMCVAGFAAFLFTPKVLAEDTPQDCSLKRLKIGLESISPTDFSSLLAQSALQNCVRELVDVGVSPDTAAQQCIQGGGTALTQQESCIERAQFQIYYGEASVREDGKTEYIYPFLNIQSGQCWDDYRNILNPQTVCWTDTIRIRRMSEQEAIRSCNQYTQPNPSASQQQNTASRPPNSPGKVAASNPLRTLRVNNNTGSDIAYLYLSPRNSDDWGEDVLGDDLLRHNYYMTFTLNSSECMYDIRAELVNGRRIEDQFDTCQYDTYNLR